MSISTELIGSAFLIGLAGSLHCVGMCGPLALSLPVPHNSDLSRIAGGLLYNTGRILSYTMMGLVFGSIGSLLISSRLQSVLSIALGVIILSYLLVPKEYFHLSGTNGIIKPFMLLRQQLSALFRSQKFSSLFFIGILNGLLPCGLVYLALSSSIISASPVYGGLFMLFFGLGTFPMMFATVFMGNYLNQSIRNKIHNAVPALLFCMAVLLMIRGLNLGIPFISPEITFDSKHAVIPCH